MNTEEKFVCISTTFLAHFWIPVTIFIRRLSEFKIDRRKLYKLPFRFEPDASLKFAHFFENFLQNWVYLISLLFIRELFE